MIDVHSHILPGIDDGSQSIEESIGMIKEAEEAGFTDIISTSHYIEETYATSKSEREELIKILQDRLEKENIHVKIHNGAEAYVCTNLIELIKEDKLPTINDTKHILMELPMHSEIIYLSAILSELMENGLTPVIAHPERYSYVQKNPKMLQEYIDKGVLFQSNYGSIIGLYGKETEKTVKKLLKYNMIYFLGTDCHRENSIYTEMPTILKKLEKLIGREKLETLTTINPQKLLLN